MNTNRHESEGNGGEAVLKPNFGRVVIPDLADFPFVFIRVHWWFCYSRFICLCLILMTACSVGPNYHAPTLELPPAWSETGPSGTTNKSAPLAQWWKNFDDAGLNSLIERAVRANYDL